MSKSPQNIRKLNKWLPIWAVIFVLPGCADPAGPPARFVRQIEWIGKGEWVKADTHIHTEFSDGAHTVSEVAFQARKHGCDVIAITDHADRNLKAATPEYADAIRAARREHPNLIILAGLEWNVPPYGGDEHATVLVAPGPREFDALAEFKSRFDDLDREPHDEKLAAAALRWLDEQYQNADARPLVIYNHPNRKTAEPQETARRINAWREVNDLVIGFSGAPGHQRGEELGAYGGAVKLFDRWDPAAAEVGGAWDTLLGAGHDIWAARAASDFHNTNRAGVADYWPGEFSETWLYAPERSADGVLQAFRAGAFFAGHGHIAREVELTVGAHGLERPAQAGEAIEVPVESTITINLSAVVPNQDWEAAENQIDVVELIVVSGNETRQIQKPIESGTRLSVSETLNVPEGGFAIRARGRRKIAGNPDLLFYTNPIRIQTPWHVLSAASSTEEHPESAGSWQRNLRAVLAAVILMLLLASFIKTWTDLSAGIPQQQTGSVPSGIRKWTAPRRTHYLAAALGFTLLAIYGSLVPLTYRELSLDVAVERFRQIPFLQLSIAHRADWVANILLFIPISYCWLGVVLVDGARRKLRFAWALPVVFVCCCLSVAIEFSQLWFPPRTVSQNDIVAECLGSMIGAVLWFAIGQRVTDWIRGYTGRVRPNSQLDWLLQAYLAGLVIYSLIPFDLTIHPVEIYRKFREGKLVLIPFWASDFGLRGLWERFTDMLIFVPVGCLATKLFIRRPHTRRSLGSAILLGAGIVAAIEFAQVFVYTRYAETTDVITGALGVAAGAWLMQRWQNSTGSVLGGPAAGGIYRSLAWSALTVVYAGILCLIFWWPLEFTSNSELVSERLDGYLRAPLASLYWGTEYNAATQFLRKTLYFLPLGLAASQVVHTLAVRGTMRRILLCGAGMFCLSVASGIELVQALLPAHVCDVTDTLLYNLGAVAGIVIRCRIADAAQPASPGAPYDGSPASGRPNFVLVSGRNQFSRAAAAISKLPSLIKWTIAGVAVAVLAASVAGIAWHDNTPPPARPQSFAELSGSHFAPAPDNANAAPVVNRIPVPDFAGAYAIWGATGRDSGGHIWFGVSAAGVEQPSAHLLEYDPQAEEVHDRGSVVTELRRAGIYRPGEGQMKIHTKIIQAADGHLYFASMDEQGEKEDGSQLPTWGSHLWRLRMPQREWEHLMAVPEGLIAVSGVGRYVYALGLFDHVLYQYDTESGATRSVRVGSVGGHISRNLLADWRGHVYVPRVRRQPDSGSRTADSTGEKEEPFPAALVEYDEQLREVAETPLSHYGASADSSSHGIIGLIYLRDRSMVFATHLGFLYRISPDNGDAPARVEPLGWFHPDGTAYTPSLFTYAGERYLVGVGKRRGKPYEWITFDLNRRQSTATPLDLSASLPAEARDLLLYGSITRDDSGAFYLAGRYVRANSKHPILLRLSQKYSAAATTTAAARVQVDERPLPVEVRPAFPQLKWTGWSPVSASGKVHEFHPLVLTHAGDGSNRLFVATQRGMIHVFPNQSDVQQTSIFLDLTKQVVSKSGYSEEGLLGLAFHPNYRQNGHFYVYYTTIDPPQTSVVSRFTVSKGDPDRADPESELEILRVKQPYWNHNGGTIVFGPDGYLYIALGDGGGGNDPHGHGQNLQSLLGSVLRIDVDRRQGGLNYAIPPDNPFVNGRDGVRPEIWAYGLRNVWRMAFDRDTGSLWAADVGQDLWEEINIIVGGGNYGWNLREGKHPFKNGSGVRADLIEPIWEYGHDIGKSITGGLVYRGRKLPELFGHYLYADYVSGRIWALKYDEQTNRVTANRLIPRSGSPLPVLSFGEDENGEIYFMVPTSTGRGLFRLSKKSK